MTEARVSGLRARVRRLPAATDGELQALYDSRAADFRPHFYPVIQLLLRRSATGVVELAREVGVSQPAMTQTLNEMRRSSLVEIRPGDDRRSGEVALTAHGREVARAVAPHSKPRP